ncbi:MAG: hypothetical protein ACYCPR_09180 [Thermoplasmataceae archaeon]
MDLRNDSEMVRKYHPNSYNYYSGYNLNIRKRSTLNRAKEIHINEGLFNLSIRSIKAFLGFIRKKIMYKIVLPVSFFLLHNYFQIENIQYRYFVNKNNSVYTERVVEIPYIIKFLNSHIDENLLEIGNVLSKYIKTSHTILDKYETGKNIINSDAVDYNPKKKYRNIVSISTFEHIGFDEPVREYGKVSKSLFNIIDLLEENGQLVITVPLGYNPEVDNLIRSHRINFSKSYFLKRFSRLNLWKETSLDDALHCKYGSKYPAANAIAILIYQNKPAE